MELRIAIRRVAPFARLTVGLQAVIKCSQEVGDHIVANAMAFGLQRFGEIAQAAARP